MHRDIKPDNVMLGDDMAAYRAGVRALRDASWKAADESFSRATTLDPDMALAQMRAAFTAKYNRPTEVRRHFARAMELRRALSERDRMMLAGLEPLLAQDPPDEVEATKRLAAATEKYPNDAELVGLHGFVGRPVIGDQAALAIARRTVTLDPEYADAWQTLGDIAGDLGDMTEARAALDRCVAVSPASIDCRSHLAMVDEIEGRCDLVEAGLRTMIAKRPEGTATLAPIWPSALFAIGQPREAVQQALDQRWPRLPETHRAFSQKMEAAALDVLYGDFARALERIEEVERTIQSAPDAQVHAVVTGLRVDIEIEIGRAPDALRHATSFAKMRDAWNAVVNGPDPTPRLLYIAHRDRDRAALSDARQKWMNRQREISRSHAWARAYGPAATPTEAREAIAALPAEGLPKSYFRYPEEGADVGRILFLVGKATDAIAPLRVGARSCKALLDPIGHTRANDTLGMALEATHDETGACAAYKVVRDRWASGKPKSITAEHALSRSTALGCK